MLVIYTQDPDGALLEALCAFALGPPFDPDRVPALTRALVEAGTGPSSSARARRGSAVASGRWS